MWDALEGRAASIFQVAVLTSIGPIKLPVAPGLAGDGVDLVGLGVALDLFGGGGSTAVHVLEVARRVQVQLLNLIRDLIGSLHWRRSIAVVRMKLQLRSLLYGSNLLNGGFSGLERLLGYVHIEILRVILRGNRLMILKLVAAARHSTHHLVCSEVATAVVIALCHTTDILKLEEANEVQKGAAISERLT